MTARNRTALFVAFCVVVIGGVGAYVYASRDRAAAHTLREYTKGSSIAGRREGGIAGIRRRSHVVFRDTTSGAMAFAALDNPGAARVLSDLECARVYYSAGSFVCLGKSRGYYTGFVVDDDLTLQHAFRMAGVPSRTRVSRDGRFGAYTLFTAADSYMAAGFSTRTRILETRTGAQIGDLEQFEAFRDGERFQAVDFNYWGVTFARDGSTFFATLGTNGHKYLVKGDIPARRVTVVYDGVECPSLSPDETRVAFKKRAGAGWRPAVLDLSTRQETVLAETRNVDDQIEWLDDRRILYAVREPGTGNPPGTSTWQLAADGGGAPELFLKNADSPAVVRH
jgi:hypothetical protein